MSENINLQNESNVLIATFNITTADTTVALQALLGMTQIDWGDDTIDNNLSHTYSEPGEYECKIYDVTSIGMAFVGCSGLTEIVIPDSVKSIGWSAFAGCKDLTRVVIHDSVTSIGVSAFNGCKALMSVVIGNGVTSIADSAFANCSSLTSVEIPDSVTSIGVQAFQSCSSLTSVVIGNSVTSIGDYAFYDCSSLMSVTFKCKEAIPVEMLTDSYINNSTPTYYVPTDSIEAYRTAWSGTVEPDKIQADPDEYLINLEGLRTYHDTLKEKYLNSMATQDWVQEQLVGKTDYLGVVDTIPNLPNAEAGDYCRVQTEFIYDEATGEKAHVGDVLIAVKDNPTQSIADWDLLHNELTSATLVTVGGVAQTSWDADTKVGFTDYANYADSGLVRGNGGNQFRYFFQNGLLYLQGATDIQIANRQTYVGLTADNIDKAVKAGITTNTETLTNEEKKAVASWIGSQAQNIPNTLVQRYESGNIAVPPVPTADVHATSKYYVDNNFIAKAEYSKNAGTSGTDGEYHGRVYAVKYDGTEETVPMANQARNYSICWRDADANIYVGDPTQQLHCINKRYAEANFVAKPTDTSGYNRVYCVTSGNAPLMQNLMYPNYGYDESGAPSRVGIPVMDKGNIGCALPTADYHTANKKYVDDLTAELRAEIVQDVIENGKGEIVQAVLDSIGCPVWGLVDENNNIILKGELADGTYTLKYEMEDGSTVDIGSLALDNNVYYTIKNNLTNCTTNNNTLQIVEGQSYSATITANDGYELKTVTVTMGGSSVTVTNGVINIASVTGNIVITAIAEEIVIPTYTNQIPISTDDNGNLFVGTNGEKGYKTNTRLSMSAGGETTSGAEGCEVTGYIPAVAGDVLRIKNITTGSDSRNVLLYYDANKKKKDSDYTATIFSIDEGNGVYASNGLRNVLGLAYIRFASENIDETSIVTRNEEIV